MSWRNRDGEARKSGPCSGMRSFQSTIRDARVIGTKRLNTPETVLGSRSTEGSKKEKKAICFIKRLYEGTA